jgi:hypothetical protein
MDFKHFASFWVKAKPKARARRRAAAKQRLAILPHGLVFARVGAAAQCRRLPENTSRYRLCLTLYRSERMFCAHVLQKPIDFLHEEHASILRFFVIPRRSQESREGQALFPKSLRKGFFASRTGDVKTARVTLRSAFRSDGLI